jgi:hypothetical protein
VRLINRIRQRLADWRRERRIRDLRACALIEAEAGRYDMAEEAAAAMRAEMRLRSPEQLQRLEKRSHA